MAEPPHDAADRPAMSDTAGSPRASARAELLALAADALAALAFVALGRRSHDEGSAVVGTLTAAWPYLAGVGAGWVGLLVLRRLGAAWPGRSLRAGALVLGSTLAVGMVLRVATGGGGAPLSFVLVAAAFLGAALLGWRALAAHLRQRQAS